MRIIKTIKIVSLAMLAFLCAGQLIVGGDKIFWFPLIASIIVLINTIFND